MNTVNTLPSTLPPTLPSTTQTVGDLLRIAHDNSETVAHEVISAYDADVAHNINVNQLAKLFTQVKLESCANFFEIAVRTPNDKKVYKRLELLADRIILAIESHMVTTCKNCNIDYCISFEDPCPPPSSMLLVFPTCTSSLC